jgi:DNA-binding winged helix-turn-helix (wHTH) protein
VRPSGKEQEQEMEEGHCLSFGPFRLDLTRDRLWRGQEAVELRAKPLAVLRYLLEHPGQVVTRGELQQPVWAGIYVTKTALRVCLREIRLALGEEAAHMRVLKHMNHTS